MNTTADNANPMPLGIDEMPMIKIDKGIQNHTVAIAAPVSNEAVGTTPMWRAGVGASASTAAGAGGAGLVSVSATMPSNLWTAGHLRHSVFPRTCRGKTPTSVPSTLMVTGDERQQLSYLGPNWFASVMGTGIVATAAASLPVHVPGLRAFAQ